MTRDELMKALMDYPADMEVKLRIHNYADGTPDNKCRCVFQQQWVIGGSEKINRVGNRPEEYIVISD